MSHVKILCENCQQKLAIPPELIGIEIECPSCGHKVLVPGQAESAQPSGKVSLKTQPPSPPAAKSSNVSLTQDAETSRSSTVGQPLPTRKLIKPMTKVLRDLTDDGELHRFIPDKAMLALSVIFFIPGVIDSIFLGIPFLVILLITVAAGVYFNTLFFIKGASWVCGRHVEQNPALVTVIFTNTIQSLITVLLTKAGISGLSFLLCLFINAWIFQLRLKEGFGKAILISLIIIALNIVLVFVLGCVGGIFFAGVWMTQQ
jgi:DNA-directed RNA polymerase subunit RPC12/RpoP